MFPLSIPGGLEIGIVVLIFILPLLLVIGIIMFVRDFTNRPTADQDQINALEARVRSLEEEIEGQGEDSQPD